MAFSFHRLEALLVLADRTETVASFCDKIKQTCNWFTWVFLSILQSTPLSSLASYHSVFLHSPWCNRWVTVSSRRDGVGRGECLSAPLHTQTQSNASAQTHTSFIFTVQNLTWMERSWFFLISMGCYFLGFGVQLVILTAGNPLICRRSPQGPGQVLTGIRSHTAAHSALFMIWFTIHESLRKFSWTRLHWT